MDLSVFSPQHTTGADISCTLTEEFAFEWVVSICVFMCNSVRNIEDPVSSMIYSILINPLSVKPSQKASCMHGSESRENGCTSHASECWNKHVGLLYSTKTLNISPNPLSSRESYNHHINWYASFQVNLQAVIGSNVLETGDANKWNDIN